MIQIDLSKKNIKIITEKLNQLLANEYVLYTKTLKFHWNVKGKSFGPLHSLFQTHYEALFSFIDDIAERSQALGVNAHGTLAEFIKQSVITEQPGINPSDITMIKDLLVDHETIIKLLRKDTVLTADLNDWGTNNFLSDLIMKHEKIAWMLRAHLENN